jgi:NADH-quinone oxidoreductase subunit J
MLGPSTASSAASASFGFARMLAQQTQPSANTGVPLSPAVLMTLCVVAGVGTVLLLPSRREASLRKVGGLIVAAAGLIVTALLVRWTGGTPRGGMGVYFWIFSAIAVFGALRVITHPKPVYSALYFVLTVFATAGLFLLLWAEFMAVALIIIYAGAILVTYVFVIMLAAEATSPADARGGGATPLAGLAEHDAISREPIAACAVGFALMGVILYVIFDKYSAIPGPSAAPDWTTLGKTQTLGAFLFQTQIVSLELAGLILTIAMVGAIMIARKRVIVVPDEALVELKPEMVTTPATPIDDNPHSIPVDGTTNPRLKAYPER